MPLVTLLSDTHGRHEEVPVAPCDLLLHAGDVTESGGEAELRDFLAWLARQPARARAFVAGNHDFICEEDPALVRALAAEAGVAYLDDEAAVLEGLRVHGSPVTPRFCDLAFNRDRGEAIRAHWAKIPAGLDILVTHGPPSGIGDLTFDDRSVGCEDLLAALGRTRPRVHVFGHIHEGFGAYAHPSLPGVRLYNAALGHTRARGTREPFLLELEPLTGAAPAATSGSRSAATPRPGRRARPR